MLLIVIVKQWWTQILLTIIVIVKIRLSPCWQCRWTLIIDLQPPPHSLFFALFTTAAFTWLNISHVVCHVYHLYKVYQVNKVHQVNQVSKVHITCFSMIDLSPVRSWNPFLGDLCPPTRDPMTGETPKMRLKNKKLNFYSGRLSFLTTVQRVVSHLMLTPWPENLGGSSRRSWRRGGRRRRGASCWRGGRRTRKPSGSQPHPCPALARPFTRTPIFFFLTSPVFTLIFSHLSFPSYTSPHGYFLLWQFVFMLVSYFVLVVLCLSSCFLTFQNHFHCMSFLSSPVDRRRATPFLVLPIPGSLRLPSVFPPREL